jgi:hypothetical protein
VVSPRVIKGGPCPRVRGRRKARQREDITKRRRVRVVERERFSEKIFLPGILARSFAPL